MRQREKIELAGVPVLIAYDRLPAPVVLLYHGLGASKETNIEELESLAGRGFVAVGVDAVGHGAREYEDFESRFDGTADETEEEFTRVVRESADEVPALVDALVARGLAGAGVAEIGIVGISMGGYIAFAAPRRDARVKAIVAISGSPEWKEDAASSPHLEVLPLSKIAILSINGAEDTVVDPQPAKRLHKKLEPSYRDRPEQLVHVEIAGADHLLTGEWKNAWERTLEFLEKTLGPRDA